MWFTFQRLLRGILLIAAASGVLLATDIRRRGSARQVPWIGILQHVSAPVLDDNVRGMIDGLAEHGYRDGETVQITLYNAQADMAASQTIAHDMCDGRYDLVLTSTTSSLQAVAGANKAGRVLHVFSAVVDPYEAGVGLDRADPLHHPRYLVGYALPLPVADSFAIARRMRPALGSVGVAWSPAETNSQVFTAQARAACKQLGIQLLETPVESSAGVREAVQSLIGKGVEAIWVGGDSAVVGALDTVIATARQARIPVFTIQPGPPGRGTLFDVGMDFYAAGRIAGAQAAELLQGADPAAMPIRSALEMVPRQFQIDRQALKGLKETWQIPEDLAKQAEPRP